MKTLVEQLEEQERIDMAAFNRIKLIRELLPKTLIGPRHIHICYIGRGSIHYAAGDGQAHLPALLEAFGRDGWTLFPQCGLWQLHKVMPMGVTILIDHVDPQSELLPNCLRFPQPSIPSNDQAVS